MLVAEGTHLRAGLPEEEGMGMVLQEILRKLDSLDSRVSHMETASHDQGSKSRSLHEEEGIATEKSLRNADYYQDWPTRQTNIEFHVFDGSRVQDWVFKSECFFELDATPAEFKVCITSVYLIGLAID